MAFRKKLQTLSVIATFLIPTPDFAGTHKMFHGISPWMAQESDHPTQTQQVGLGANDVVKVGPDVSPPVLIHFAEPKFSKAVRKSRVHGIVVVNSFVEASGSPSNVHVFSAKLLDGDGNSISDPESTPEGQELAKAAVDAVNRYRFKPAMKNGKPVKVALNVEVTFQLID